MTFLILLGALALPAAGEMATPAGRWLTDDRSAVIQIAPCGARWCGRIVEIRDPAAPPTDINNPDARLRKQPLVGTAVLTGLQAAGGEWREGRAYDPKTGRSYRARLSLDGAAGLNVTGCVLFICQTRRWSRLAAAAYR